MDPSVRFNGRIFPFYSLQISVRMRLACRRRLGDMAPVTRHVKGTGQGSSLVGKVCRARDSGASGLAAPQMCTRVAQNPAPGVPASWVASGKPVLGTWQQIFHLECDVRGRQRIGGNQGDRGLAWSNDAPLKERLLELNMRAEKWERAPKRSARSMCSCCNRGADGADRPRQGRAAHHQAGLDFRVLSPNFLFEVGISGRMIEPTPVFMRL